MTTPHTPPAALDVAAIEARAAAATAATARVARVIASPRRERGEVVRVKRESDVATHESAADVPALLAALRAERAQHAADVAAAVAGERGRIVATLRALADSREHSYPTCLEARALRDAARALDGTTPAAPTGGRE